jgi:hypothetical protein
MILHKAGLEGTQLVKCVAAEQVNEIVQNLKSLAVLNWN